MSQKIIIHILDQLVEIEKGTPWLDESFAKKFKPVNNDNAFVRPQPDIHSIAEIMSHLIVWRYEILSRLEGNPRKLSGNSPENWKTNEELKPLGWENLIQQFKDSQDKLTTLLKSKQDPFLETPYGNKNFKYLVDGILHHDLYHLGQIGLVNKMLTP